MCRVLSKLTGGKIMKVTEEEYLLLRASGKLQALLYLFGDIFPLYDDKEIGDDLSKAYNLVQDAYWKLSKRYEISDTK